MTGDRIIVFVDGFPYSERRNLQVLKSALVWQRPIQPGFGYSVNVKAELFAGLRPDEIGFLNEWGYAPGQGWPWMRASRGIYSIVSRCRPAKRLVSKVLSRITGKDIRNIPLPMLSSFVRTGVNAYEGGFPSRTLLDGVAMRRYLHSELGGDKAACDALCRDLDRSRREPFKAFLAMAELDHIFHRDGEASSHFATYVENVDRQLKELWQLLVARDNQPGLCLVSDHGMAPVRRVVSCDVEKGVHGAGERYTYFVDATMARFWFHSDLVQQEVRGWLTEGDLPGRCIDDEERKRWGISSAAFGHLIFLLDEGSTFAPNFFSDKPCRAMHGYAPELRSQLGLIACSVVLDSETVEQPLPAIQAFKVMEKFALGK